MSDVQEKVALKPCPFCGFDYPKRITWDDARISGFIRHAIDCPVGAGGCGVRTKWQVSAASAIEAWNRRALSTEPTREPEQGDGGLFVRSDTRHGHQLNIGALLSASWTSDAWRILARAIIVRNDDLSDQAQAALIGITGLLVAIEEGASSIPSTGDDDGE